MRGRGDGTRRSGDGRGGGIPPQRLGQLLQTEALRHEPDRERILTWLRERETAGTAPAASPADRRSISRTPGADPVRLSPARRRVPFGRPLVAAGVAALVVAGVAGAYLLGGRSTSTRYIEPAGTDAGSRSVGPPPSIPSGVSPSRPSPSSHAGAGGNDSGSMSASPASLAGAVMIGVSPVAGGTEVTFPRAGDRDWIVLGSRPDGVAVRNKRPSQALGTVTTPGAAASVVDGPYRIAYTGGVPQQSSAGAGTWQLVTADKSSQQVTVPLHGGTFTVDLFAGTVRTTGVVTVRLSGSGPVTPATAIVPPCRTDVCADVVSVSVDASRLPGGGTSGELVIELGAERSQGGPGLGLAAVALR